MGIVYTEGAKYRKTKMTIFSMKTLLTVSTFIFGMIILLRKRRLPFHRDRYQFNVVTLKETLAIVLIFYLDALNYMIEIDKYLELLILSGVSLLIPVLLIIKTKRSYPSLWTEFDDSSTRRSRFFITRQTVKPRPSCNCEILVENEKKRKFIYVKSSNCLNEISMCE